jgi:hypothetical protein
VRRWWEGKGRGGAWVRRRALNAVLVEEREMTQAWGGHRGDDRTAGHGQKRRQEVEGALDGWAPSVGGKERGRRECGPAGDEWAIGSAGPSGKGEPSGKKG